MKLPKYTKFHGGTDNPRVLHRGTALQPAKIHVGSGRPLGVTHGAPQPQIYGTHGGTNLPRTLKRRK